MFGWSHGIERKNNQIKEWYNKKNYCLYWVVGSNFEKQREIKPLPQTSGFCYLSHQIIVLDWE